MPGNSSMRIYLDVSCLNRPFDDQSQPRIRLESEAITMILAKFDRGVWDQVSSEMVTIEVTANSDEFRRRRVNLLLPGDTATVKLTEATFARAAELETMGLKPADATHVAAAESSADVFLTCDDRLLRAAARNASAIHIPVANPLDWIAEQEDDANA
jgi:predicted nucleic acid-binding protein